MEKKKADSHIIRLIYKLAGTPSQVKTTQRAYYDILAYGITREGICEAIREWIDADKPVEEGITSQVKQHVGKPYYVFKPVFQRKRFYVKVQIELNQLTGEYMLIISVHP